MRRNLVKFGVACAVAAIVMPAIGVDAATKKGKVTTISDQLTKDVLKVIGKPFPVVKGSTTRGVSADAINIGVVTDLTGGGQPVYYGGCEGVRARFERANRTKELKHRINTVGCVDAASDTSKFPALAKDMVEGKKAFGLITVGTANGESSKYLNDTKVPYVGWGITTPFCGWDKPFGFGFSGSLVCSLASFDPTKALVSDFLVGGFAKATGKDPKTLRVAVLSEDNQAGRLGNPIQIASVEAVGGKVVYAKSALPAPPTPIADYTPYVTEVLKSDPNMIELSVSAQNVPGLAATFKAAGYKGDLYQFVFFDSGILQVKDLAAAVDGTVAVTPGFGSPVFGGADWDRAADDVKQAGDAGKFFCDKAGPVLVGCGLGFTTHYGAADFYVQAFKALEASKKPITTENFVNLINGGWNYPGISNVVCPARYPVGHVASAPCGSFVRWDVANQKLVPLADLNTYTTKVATVPAG